MSIINDMTKPVAQTVPVDQSFYKKFPSGATMGRADELDQSGRPFVGYRNPGDEATTTDKTRVAPTFDPTVPQKLTHEQYYNPRAVADRTEIRQKLGAGYSDELDHAMALAVGGSNDISNLRVIPGRVNQAYGKYEAELASKIRNGELSYLDAQIAEAKKKNLKSPWMPPELRKNPSIWDEIKSSLVNILTSGKSAPVEAGGSTKKDPIKDMSKSYRSLFLQLVR